MPSAPSDPVRWLPWLARLGWIVVGVVGSSVIGDAVADRSSTVATTAQVVASIAWLAGVFALVWASTFTLTLARVVVPLSGVAALACAVAGERGTALAGFAVAAVATSVVVHTGEVGRAYVQASAYGDEERHPLRPPLGLAIVSTLAWLLWAAAVAIGPLLLAARGWVIGGLLAVAAAAGVPLLLPRWHQLARRWLVLVPAGVVVHDPVVLAETLMLRRSQVARLRLAPADTGALDLTGPASGHALELATTESVTALLVPPPGGDTARAVHLTACLVSPSRPGAALRSAAARRLPVG
ncbi:MAG: hypothetical protein MUE78_08405 [Ilumatobacteraceae bacterium]|jgi:hypothetical protein|nr:hypothetical protein [Ilumatobacteraceae bacterium]